MTETTKTKTIVPWYSAGSAIIGPDRSRVFFSQWGTRNVRFRSPGAAWVKFKQHDIADIRLGNDAHAGHESSTVPAGHVPFTITLHDGRTWTIGVTGNYLLYARKIANRFDRFVRSAA